MDPRFAALVCDVFDEFACIWIWMKMCVMDAVCMKTSECVATPKHAQTQTKDKAGIKMQTNNTLQNGLRKCCIKMQTNDRLLNNSLNGSENTPKEVKTGFTKPLNCANCQPLRTSESTGKKGKDKNKGKEKARARQHEGEARLEGCYHDNNADMFTEKGWHGKSEAFA